MEQVTLFNPEADRLECTPVLVIPLCRVLLWSPRCAPLSLLAACMNLPFFSATSSPSVPSMVIALLTHLALFDPMEDNMLTTVDDLPSFLTSCINALVRPEQLSLAVEDVQEGAMGVILASRGYDVPATSLPLQHCVNTQTPAPLPEEEPANTLRCRVLVYLLTTLSASKLSVAHYLLGLYALILEEIMSQTTIPTSMKAHDPLTKSTSLRSPIPNAPISCLDAILDLLLFSNNGQNNSFLSSKDCALCMELLYRVCVDSRTSLAMLGLLRKRSVSAVPRLLRAFATRLSFVGNNLERGNGDAHFFMHSIAWLLKICTMDIQVTRTLLCFARNNETTLLEMLLFPSSEEQQDQQSEGLLLHMINKCATMCSPLLTIVNLSSISSLLMRVSDPISVSVSIAQGVERACGDDDSNNPPMCSHYNIPSLRRILTSSSSAVSSGGGVEGNIDLITSQTLELNRYGAQTAAITHLAQAVKQLIEVCVDHEESSVLLSPLNHDTLQSIELSLERWIQYVLTPLLNMILKQLHFEMSFLEPLLRALFATLTLIRDLMEISNKNVSSSSSFLSLPLNDYEDLLKGLLRALLRRGCDVAIPASSLYTSHLLSCFMVTLQLGSFSHGDGYSNVTLAALEPRTVELTELLCRQMEDTVSLPSLLLLLQALRGSHSEYPFSNQREAQLVGGFISPALIQCLDVLQNKGFLSKLVHSLEKESIGNSGIQYVIKRKKEHSQIALLNYIGPALEMTLSLFTELTLLANGTQLLQETQLLHVLLARKDVEAELVGERSLLQVIWCFHKWSLFCSPFYHPPKILRLFSSLLYSSASGDLISGVVKYVNQNRQLLRLLRLREGSSWLRLQLTDAFVSLLLAVAARTLSMRPSRKEKEQTSSFLGPITDMIITYLCNLLGFIGTVC